MVCISLINLNYRSIIGDYDASVGIQGSSNTGSQVMFGNDDLENNLNITFKDSPDWVSVNPDAGTLMDGQSEAIEITANSNALNEGNYTAHLKILSDGGNASLPVTLTVEDSSLLGDTNGDDVINVLDVIIIVNMILGTVETDLNTADMNNDGVVNVLDITLLLNLILNG